MLQGLVEGGSADDGEAGDEVEGGGRLKGEGALALLEGVAAVEERDGSELKAAVIEALDVDDGGEVEGLASFTSRPVLSMAVRAGTSLASEV